jgi:hypothetical protein
MTTDTGHSRMKRYTHEADQPDESGGIEKLERRLIELGKRVNSESPTALRHPGQATHGEWRGADVRITSDFAWEPANFMEGHERVGQPKQ